MSDQPDYDFTAAHYATLSQLEQAVVRGVAMHLTAEPIDPPDDESLATTFNILRPCDGCIPEEEVGEDLLEDIRRKFSCVYFTAVERAAAELEAEGLRFFDDFSFCLVTDPCYQDSTHVAVVDLRPELRPFCYFHEYTKAWHFSFASLKEIATEVVRAQATIRSTFLALRTQFHNAPQTTPPGGLHE